MNIFVTSAVVVVKVACEWNSLDSLKPRIIQVVITENKKKQAFQDHCKISCSGHLSPLENNLWIYSWPTTYKNNKQQ